MYKLRKSEPNQQSYRCVTEEFWLKNVDSINLLEVKGHQKNETENKKRPYKKYFERNPFSFINDYIDWTYLQINCDKNYTEFTFLKIRT